MNTNKQLHVGITTKPIPINVLYAGKKEIFTINLNIVKNSDNISNTTRNSFDNNAETYSCVTLCILHDGHLTANQLIREIVKTEMFYAIDTAFLKRFVAIFNIADYDQLTAILISGKYTYPDELSCHRKALLGDLQPLEDLNNYIEMCKALASQCFDEKTE